MSQSSQQNRHKGQHLGTIRSIVCSTLLSKRERVTRFLKHVQKLCIQFFLQNLRRVTRCLQHLQNTHHVRLTNGATLKEEEVGDKGWSGRNLPYF